MKYVEILSALLTPVIAIITTYIAVQQYRSGKARFRHDLYDRRMAIFKATSKYLAVGSMPITLGDSQIENENQAYQEFVAANAESQFLFDEDLVLYLGLIHATALTRFMLRLRQKNSSPSERKSIENELSDTTRKLSEQNMGLRKVFLKYLNLRKLK